MDDVDVRNAILLLVQASKLYAARAAAAHKVLSSVMALHPTKRSALTPEYVNSETAKMKGLADQDMDRAAAALEKALKDGSDFESLLQMYASQLLRQ